MPRGALRGIDGWQRLSGQAESMRLKGNSSVLLIVAGRLRSGFDSNRTICLYRLEQFLIV